MYEYEHSLETDASADAIYALYSDVNLWPQWDAGLERVEIDKAFGAGARGIMKFIGQEPLPFVLTDVQPGAGFTDETTIPGAGVIVRFNHSLTATKSGRTRITHRVSVEGAGAEQIGPMITADVPEAMEALAAHAKRR